MRLAFILSGVMVLVIMVISGLTFYLVNSQVQDDLEVEVKYNTEQLMDYSDAIISVYFDTIISELEVIADSDLVEEVFSGSNDPNLKGQLSQRLAIMREDNPVLDNVALHDAKGILYVSDDEGSAFEGRDFSERDYYKGVLSTKKPYISEAFVSVTSNKVSLAVAVPVIDYSGVFRGYVLGVINLDQLEAALAGLQKDSHLVLLDRYDNLFFVSGQITNVINDEDLVEKHNIDAVRKRGSSEGVFESVVTSHDGVDYFMGFKDYGYVTIIFSREYDGVFSFLSNVRDDVWISSVISLVFGVVVMFFVALLVARPINRIAKDVDEITKGNLDVGLGSSFVTEQKNLIDSLNRVLASLKLAILRTQVGKGGLGISGGSSNVVERKSSSAVKMTKNGVKTGNPDLQKKLLSLKKESDNLKKESVASPVKKVAEPVKRITERLVEGVKKVNSAKEASVVSVKSVEKQVVSKEAVKPVVAKPVKVDEKPIEKKIVETPVVAKEKSVEKKEVFKKPVEKKYFLKEAKNG